MLPGLQALLTKVRTQRNFDPAKWIEQKCQMFNEYLSKSGLHGAVINMSGGIDSSVTAALCIHASQMPNSPLKQIIGIAQPIHVCSIFYTPFLLPNTFRAPLEFKTGPVPYRKL